MTEAVYSQSNFLGGEWSPLAQGRSEQDAYRTAMNVCLNGVPVEEGAWVRRSGTEYIGPTAGRTSAKLLPFQTDDGQSITMEFTAALLQFYSGTGRVCTNDRRTIAASATDTGTLTMTLDAAHGWIVGDAVVLWIPISLATTETAAYRNRVLRVMGVPATDELILADDIGGALPVDTTADAFVDCKVLRLKRFTTPWTTSLDKLHRVQAQDKCIILSATVPPYTLSVTTEETGDNAPVFSALTQASFVDGPYLDKQPDTATVSAYTGTITVTPASTAPASSDVGRHIRLWSEPPAWNSGTTYTYGQTVKYNGDWWMSIASGTFASSNVGVTPGTLATIGTQSVVLWAAAPTAGQWAWGTITATSGTTYTVALVTPLNAANGATVSEWRLGVYTANQYPTCGVYHDGRLWLAGAIKNRLDVSTTTDMFTFSPSDANGLVTDSHAISAMLNFDELATILWMVSDQSGVILGTVGGQVLVTASQLDDVFSPWSRQAKKVARHRAANVQPVLVGSVVVFVEKTKRRLIEYFLESLTNRAAGMPLNEMAMHLTSDGIAEIVYQETPVPAIWIRDEQGQLTGITYRRVSHYVSEPPKFAGAHRHQIADGQRVVVSMCVGIDNSELYDLLYLCTAAPDGSDCAVEILRPLLREE